MGRSLSLRFLLASLVLAGPATAQLTDADVNARIREGVLRFERGDLAGAQRSFEAVLAERPDHVVATYELAYTHVRQGEPDRALAIIDGAFARDLAVTAEYHSLGASIVDGLGRPDEAVLRFQQGIAAFPENHNLHLNLGITHITRGDGAAARASFERAITLNPEHPTAHFYVGQIYAAEGLIAAGVLALGKGIGVDNVEQRRVAAAGIIKRLMDDSAGLGEEGVPIVVMPVDYYVPPMTMQKLTAAVGMHYAAGFALQKKSEGDLSYEPYAMAFSLLATEFARAGIDPASHFAADYYQRFFSEMVENGQQMTYSHVILAPLNPGLASTWAQANGERVESFRVWTRSR